MRKNVLFLTVVSFISLFTVQALLMLLLFAFLKQKPENNNWGIIITNISFLIIIWLTVRLFNIKFKFRFSFPKLKILIYIFLLAICFIINYPFISILNFTTDISNNIIEFTNLNFSINRGSTVYFFITVFITPVLEELYYRKIILFQIEKRYNVFWAVLISSILFSVFHMEYMQSQISFVFGLLSGYLYAKTKRIEISILLHSLINILVIITSSSVLPFNENYYVLAIYLLVVLFGYLLITKIVNRQ